MFRCGIGRCILTFLLLLTFTTLANADEIRVEYTFERPQVSQVSIGDRLYHRVIVPGAPSCGNSGEPALPGAGAQILLPEGSRVTSVEVLAGQRVVLGSGFHVEPVARPVKLSSVPGDVQRPIPDPAIYSLKHAFPEKQFAVVGTQEFRGYRMLILKLQPVQYIPAAGALSYTPKLTVVVHTAAEGRPSMLYRGLPGDRTDLLRRVDNPEAIAGYSTTRRGLAPGYDLLILTTPSLAASFEPLKTYHNATGVATEIRTTADVGGNDPDAVRDYIRQRYQQDGIDYVLIGGDDGLIPAKDLWVGSWGPHPPEEQMPADFYFACLDGTYNYDGDNRWGEPTDGAGGGDVDLVAEVYIGRAAVDDTTEAARFVNKTIWYLQGNHSDTEHVLLAGEYLGFGGDSNFAALTLEELVDGSSTHGYTTTGIPSSEYTIDELFERDEEWSLDTILSRFNDESLHIVNHLGHATWQLAMKINNNYVVQFLENEDLCFVYSQGCDAGRFDDRDCWAEFANIKTDAGAFAVIMNARLGWGMEDSTDGPSQRYNREFWDAMFGEGLTTLGRANQDSKEDNIYRINEDCMRWCAYELTLFGDPTISLTGQAPPPPPPEGAVLVAGPGPTETNPCQVRVFDAENITAVPAVSFSAYGTDKYGVNVALGDIDGDGDVEIVCGPGPGAVFGPHVRAFELDGTPLAGVSFLAYGTNKFGVNVACGDVDGDGIDEIITGAGPGAVFGPHVRGWNYDGGTVAAIPGVSFFAYGTPKYGVNVSAGDVDGDGTDEIITGAGPGTVFGPHVRAFKVGSGTVTPVSGISFFAYGTLKYGVNVSAGDIDGDGRDELVTGVGPGAALGTHVRAFDFQGGQISPIAAVSFFAYPGFTFGVRVGCGDRDGNGRCEIYTGPGPDPDAGTRVRGWNYDGGQLTAIPGFDYQAFGGGVTHGVNVAVSND